MNDKSRRHGADFLSLLPDLTIEEILSRWPQTAPIFMEQGGNCIGCYMARFCTLEEMTRIYHLPLEAIVARLRQFLPRIPT